LLDCVIISGILAIVFFSILGGNDCFRDFANIGHLLRMITKIEELSSPRFSDYRLAIDCAGKIASPFNDGDVLDDRTEDVELHLYPDAFQDRP